VQDQLFANAAVRALDSDPDGGLLKTVRSNAQFDTIHRYRARRSAKF